MKKKILSAAEKAVLSSQLLISKQGGESLVRRLYCMIVDHHDLLDRTQMPDGSVHVPKCPICSDPMAVKTIKEAAAVMDRKPAPKEFELTK